MIGLQGLHVKRGPHLISGADSSIAVLNLFGASRNFEKSEILSAASEVR